MKGEPRRVAVSMFAIQMIPMIAKNSVYPVDVGDYEGNPNNFSIIVIVDVVVVAALLFFLSSSRTHSIRHEDFIASTTKDTTSL